MNGLLLINKASGVTSHDVVARARKLLGTREVGHSGTLDPLASGLMVLLIGEATKLSSYVTEGDKSYHVGVRLGITTDTLDITGQVLTEKQVQSTKDQVQHAALQLHGEMHLPIPMFSAKKVDGKKLYEYAREGVAIEIPHKNMTFWNVEAREDAALKNTEFSFHLHCSKGSFIRSWVSLLGDRLGCGATMVALQRTSSHRFSLADAMTFEQLEEMSAESRGSRLVPMDQALGTVKSIRVSGQDAVLLRNGQISHSLRTQLISRFNPSTDTFVQILPEKRGSLLALIGLEPGQGFKIKRVFNS